MLIEQFTRNYYSTFYFVWMISKVQVQRRNSLTKVSASVKIIRSCRYKFFVWVCSQKSHKNHFYIFISDESSLLMLQFLFCKSQLQSLATWAVHRKLLCLQVVYTANMLWLWHWQCRKWNWNINIKHIAIRMFHSDTGCRRTRILMH